MGRAVDLGPAGVGDHAVGAELVAAAGDADIGAASPIAVYGRDHAPQVERFERVAGGGQRRGPARAAALQGDLLGGSSPGLIRVIAGERGLGPHGIIEQLRQLVELGGAAHDVHDGHAGDEVGAIPLGHAPEHADDEIRAVEFSGAHVAQSRPDLLLGPLSHRAGVVEHDVGVLGIAGEAVAQGSERAGDELRVELVHLAPEGLEIDGFLRHGRVVYARKS